MNGLGDYYQIIRGELFDKQVLVICGSYTRMTALDMGIDWALCRFNIKGLEDVVEIRPNHYLWVTSKFMASSLPQVRILFHVNEARKLITLIEISEV